MPDSDEANYARVWRGKAAVARMLQRRQAELFHQAAADPAARRDIETWRDVRGQARPAAPGHRRRPRSSRAARPAPAAHSRKGADRAELAEAIPEFARHQALERSPHTKLVEVAPRAHGRPRPGELHAIRAGPADQGEKGSHRTPSYIGFVLAKGRPVRAVDLGPAAPIDEAVGTWRKAITRRQASPAAEIIRHLVWEPLARQFAARDDDGGSRSRWQLDRSPLGRTARRQARHRAPGAVRPGHRAPCPVPPRPAHRAGATDRRPRHPAGRRRRGLRSGPQARRGRENAGRAAGRAPAETARGRGDGWRELPGTLDELNAVTQLAGSPRPWFASREPAPAPPSSSATCPAPAGRTSPPTASSPIPASRSVLRPDPKLFSSIGRERVGAGLRNPLVLSGLVLAGANRPSADVDGSTRDDLGILTAEAIAGLPLQDLELVVLSACETGLGLVGGGEGVFGLQRAFHLAGAHNVVASLWKVDDQATAALMAIFYDQLWRQHKPPIEALRTAQLTLYRHPERIGELAKRRGTPDFDKLVQRPEPGPDQRQPAGAQRAPIEQWAAFVLSGWGNEDAYAVIQDVSRARSCFDRKCCDECCWPSPC